MQWWYSSSIAIWLITITTTIELTSQSEILIIRHGRSRSRHSAEKEHVRWGLKAFDNLTIFSEHHDAAADSLEGAAAVTGDGGGNVISFYEHNGTLSPSSDFNGTIGSYEINYTFGPSRTAVASNSEEHGRHHHTQNHKNVLSSTTTEMTKIPVHVIMDQVIPKKVRRNGSHRKSEIMTNIKSTVNRGIQYLKSHENLDEIEIEINDMNANRKRLTKGNKMRSTSVTQQQHKLPKQIKMNGGEGKEFTRIVTVPISNKSNAATAALTSSFKTKKAASNHIKIHQAHNEIDLHIKSNLADNFYGLATEKNHSPRATHNNVHATTADDHDDGEMLSDEPAGKGDSNKMEIKESLMEKSNQLKFDANQNRTVASTRNVTTSTDNNLSKMNATHANEISNSTSNNKTKNLDKSQLNANQMSDNVDSHHDLIQNDDGGEAVEIIEDISIQNDEISNENTIDLAFDAAEEGELDENSGNFNGIYHVEDFDLSNLDETSRNNRKNLMRGRDVVTRFLQIVESQHMMGNNCTAGTALNLGEGVVDRYAQDRFRVEAEVAVNRANMLTRQVHLF